MSSNEILKSTNKSLEKHHSKITSYLESRLELLIIKNSCNV